MNKKGQSGKKHSEETKRKIGEKTKLALTGKKRGPMSEETKRKIGLANKNKVRSKALREHLSKVLSGRRQSDEHRNKITSTKFGRTHSDQTRKKLRERFLGTTLSPETRAKISASQMGREQSIATRVKIRNAVLSRPPGSRIVQKDTSIERMLVTELTRRGFKVETQVPFLCYAVDILLPDYRIVIEADGCRYHYCPDHQSHWLTQDPVKVEKARLKDRRKTVDLETAGFRVFRFWECSIRKSLASCVDIIWASCSSPS